MESILLDTMFELPSMENVDKVVINKDVVESAALPDFSADAPKAAKAKVAQEKTDVA
jgi:ATP-dependent protease Clp ATPase subunit